LETFSLKSWPFLSLKSCGGNQGGQAMKKKQTIKAFSVPVSKACEQGNVTK